MNIDYFRAAEREISSLPLLKRSLPIMRKRLEGLIEAGAPKEPSGVDFSKPYVDSHHVNDTLGELCALLETQNEIHATEQKIREIEEILEAVPEEQRTVLTLFYEEKLTAEQIAERIHVESEKTVYNIRNKGIATYSILCYGALASRSESSGKK
jgi:RNA polymerase sigma factor (sigma-70 family)